MVENSPLNTKSLKEQVYDFLRMQIHLRILKPGMAVSLDRTSQALGISRTPLRDALIQLEMEGFVTIKSRRGIYVNGLRLEEIGHFYQLIGALEQSAILMAGPFGLDVTGTMQRLNEDMRKALDEDAFDRFYALNLEFHNTFLLRSRNPQLIRIVDNLKKRLYDFPSQEKWLKDWEMRSINEHEQVVQLLEKGDLTAAARFIHDVHWGFKYQKPFIEQYYFPSVED